MKRLSVIVPGYNTRKEWWVRCVASIRRALTAEDEIIVVDDGSREPVSLDDLVGAMSGRDEWEWEGEVGDMSGRGRESFSRRALAEKKIESWLLGVTQESFDTALEGLIAEKALAGDYRFKRSEEKMLALSGARRFFDEFARKIVELSDGRCVYFAPDARSRDRNGNDLSRCWAEYAFHAVSNGGAKLVGKSYHERWYNPYKVANMDLIEPALLAEQCVPVLKRNGMADAIKFFGKTHDQGNFDVVARLDECGNAGANMTEVTFEASTKKIKSPRLVPLAEAVQTVVSHQTTAGSYPLDKNNISNFIGIDNPSGGWFGKCEIRVVRLGKNSGLPTARNRGLEVAQGRFVTFVDSDDEVREETYEKCLARMEETGADLAVYGVQGIYEGFGLTCHDVPEDKYYGELTPADVAYLVKRRLFYYSCNKVFRKDFIDRHAMRFNPEGVPCEDAIFNVGLVMNRAKWVTVGYCGYKYYRYDGSIVSRYKPTYVQGTRACTQAWKDYKAAIPGAYEAMEKFGLGWYDETPDDEIRRRQWTNIWRRGTPYTLAGRYRYARDNADVLGRCTPLVFIKQAMKMWARKHLYLGPIRRYHQKRFLKRIGARVESF